jgi:hypothetical protein
VVDKYAKRLASQARLAGSKQERVDHTRHLSFDHRYTELYRSNVLSSANGGVRSDLPPFFRSEGHSTGVHKFLIHARLHELIRCLLPHESDTPPALKLYPVYMMRGKVPDSISKSAMTVDWHQDAECESLGTKPTPCRSGPTRILLPRCIRPHPDPCGLIRIRADSSGSVRTHLDPCGLIWIRADSSGSVRTHPDLCGLSGSVRTLLRERRRRRSSPLAILNPLATDTYYWYSALNATREQIDMYAASVVNTWVPVTNTPIELGSSGGIRTEAGSDPCAASVVSTPARTPIELDSVRGICGGILSARDQGRDPIPSGV